MDFPPSASASHPLRGRGWPLLRHRARAKTNKRAFLSHGEEFIYLLAGSAKAKLGAHKQQGANAH
jgi:hypothetical protein